MKLIVTIMFLFVSISISAKNYSYRYWYTLCDIRDWDNGTVDSKYSFISKGKFTITVDVDNKVITLNSNGIKEKFFISYIIVDDDEDGYETTTYHLENKGGFMYVNEDGKCWFNITEKSDYGRCTNVYSNDLIKD